MIGKLRRVLDYLLRATRENPRLSMAHPAVDALDTFLFGKGDVTAGAPHVREYMDLKRFMSVVLACLLPCAAWGIYSFGWRVAALIAVSYAFGVGTEAIFAGARKETLSEGAFVTCMLFPLTLPPTTPFWVCAVGIVFGIVFGKEVFGGTGYNVFNPALVGRCFVYISFPRHLVGNVWTDPIPGAAGGFAAWDAGVDAVTSATPSHLVHVHECQVPFADLLFGLSAGSAGETLRIWIIAAGLILALTRVASFSIMISTVIGAFATSAIGHYAAPVTWPCGAMGVLGGGLLFGAVFMATDPVSGPRHPLSRWLYGLGIGAVSVLIWMYSGYPQGVMFAILLMNIAAPILDHFAVRRRYRARRARA
ncbi:MAG TPA: RnfABCDGE type electron transport complex subunit D [Planctomycetes bacterium]|nr:RnfABCDGE type electron transport complex subunit D [Planctomycetota bacterium]